ncbi:MAG: hypothetical protein ACKOYM_11645 [Actinomycetes bacterium]
MTGTDRTALPTSTKQLRGIGAVLTLVVVVLGSLMFGRYDWTGLPLVRTSNTAVKVVSARCTERIHPYRTESGRVVGPIVVDEQQYLALVAYYRGVPRAELQVNCLYDPFTNRSGTSWIAHWLPFEEGLALGIVNTVMTVLALWMVLLGLRAAGHEPKVVLAGGLLFAVSWNTVFFSSAILVDSGVVALIALSWYLLVSKRPWWVWPIMLLGYPIKETVGIVVPVTVVWAWNEYRAGRRSALAAAGPAIAAAVAFVVGVAYWRGALPAPDAAWPVKPNVAAVLWNLGNGFGFVALALGALPLVVLSFWGYRVRARTDGWWSALIDPAAVGVLLAMGINFWAFITVKTSPRLFWIGFPFAVPLAARWLSQGRPWERLQRVRVPGLDVPDSSSRRPADDSA